MTKTKPLPPTMAKCWRCNGRGITFCPMCDGLGTDTDDDGDEIECATCQGEGVVDCRECGGTGEWD